MSAENTTPNASTDALPGGKLIDFMDREYMYDVIQKHADRGGVVTGRKGTFDNREDAEAMIVTLKNNYKDREYVVVPRKI